MTITQLMQFRTIAIHENISYAAQELYISQSSLSMSLKKLEAEVGKPLFDRYKNRLHLNADGKELLAHAEVIFTEVSAIEQYFSEKSAVKRITISSPMISFSRYCIPRLKTVFPDLHINSGFIDSDEILEALFLQGVDIIFSPYPFENEPRIHAEFLTEEEYLVAVPLTHPLSRRTELLSKDINHTQFALVRSKSYNFRFFFQQLAEHNIQLDTETFEDSLTFYQTVPHLEQSLMISSSFGRDYFNSEAHVRFLPLTDFSNIPIYAVCLKKNAGKYAAILAAIHEILT